jgi:energy-converting hydrogenase Eha subunit H
LSFEDFVTPTRAPEKNHSVSHVSSQKKKKNVHSREKKIRKIMVTDLL